MARLFASSVAAFLLFAALAGCEEERAGVKKPVIADIDGDGTADADDDDIDGDGIPNNIDLDIDGDGIPNDADDDVDGDGIANADDETAYGPPGDGTGPQADPDGDGIPNHADDDDDGDGLPDGVVGINDRNGDGQLDENENNDGDGFCIDPEVGYFACDDGAPPGSGLPDNDNDTIPDVTDPDDDNDGFPDETDPTDDGVGDCQNISIAADERLDPRILLIVDKSGSMGEEATGFGGRKWDAARQTLSAVVSGLESAVEFGLMLYPDGNNCGAGSVNVNVALNSADAIVARLDATNPNGRTPTASTLRAALGEMQALGDDGGARAVILATDGGPNCNTDLNGQTCVCVGAAQNQCAANPISCLDDEASIDAAAALNDAGFPVFVIGIPGSEDFSDVLNGLAASGGTAQAGNVSFYDANDAQALATAIEDVAVRLGSCRFDLPGQASVADLEVRVGNTVIDQDAQRQDGWDLVDGDTVELFGGACDEARAAGATINLRVCLG